MQKSNLINRVTNHAVTNKENDKFVGIKIKNEKIDFYYPESYDLSDPTNIKDYRKDIFSILKTIELSKGSNSIDKINSSNKCGGDFMLVSYLWIIQDYLNNGIYINREDTLKLNQNGKVNWKRTLETQPIISNGKIIYNNIIVQRKEVIDDIIVQIHKFCIKHSIDVIGWLYNLNSKQFHDIKSFKNQKKIYINTLKKELNNTFDDVKKTRFKHMINILQGVDDNSMSNEFVYGVDNYHIVFETMIDKIFGNVTNKKEYNPIGEWHLEINDYSPKKSSSLRPDTILINDKTNTAYILDSKFYRFGITGEISDLPETTSIHKQITYGEFMTKQYKGKYNLVDVKSAFLLPFNKNDNIFNTSGVFHYIGFATGDWKELEGNNYVKIHSILVDLKHVVEVWNKLNHDEEIEELISLM